MDMASSKLILANTISPSWPTIKQLKNWSIVNVSFIIISSSGPNLPIQIYSKQWGQFTSNKMANSKSSIAALKTNFQALPLSEIMGVGFEMSFDFNENNGSTFWTSTSTIGCRLQHHPPITKFHSFFTKVPSSSPNSIAKPKLVQMVLQPWARIFRKPLLTSSMEQLTLCR